jgi:uridine phosphorylase
MFAPRMQIARVIGAEREQFRQCAVICGSPAQNAHVASLEMQRAKSMSFKQQPLLAAASIAGLMAFTLMPPVANAQSAKQNPSAAMKTEMQEADKDMGLVLKKLGELNAKPVSTLTVEQARA